MSGGTRSDMGEAESRDTRSPVQRFRDGKRGDRNARTGDRASRRGAGPERRRGAVLIVVLGILVILALMATAFAVIQANERGVSRNYVDAVRAKLVAQSGIEDGLQRLHQTLGTGIGALTKEVNKDPAFACEVDENPLNADTTLRKIKVNGQALPFTGVLSNNSYGAHSDFYVLKVRDLQGLIHVNDGLGEPGHTDVNGDGLVNPNDSSVSQNLRRILNNLGANAAVGVPGLGDKIVNKRPLGGYRVIEELETVLGAASYQKAAKFLTTKAWVDRDVANPVPLSAQTASLYPVQYYRGSDVYRYGRNKNATGAAISTSLVFTPPGTNGTQNAVFGMDELNPQHIQIVERAPVNVNTAPREVLVALLDGLRGFFLLERRQDHLPGWTTVYQWLSRQDSFDTNGVDKGAVGFLYETVPIVGPGSGTATGISAASVAEHLMACREKRATSGVTPSFDYASVWWGGPILSWRQFNRFCDNLVTIGLFVDDRNQYFDGSFASAIQKQRAAQAIADVLKANFNPNLHLNETNPDANLHTLVDKTDLVVHSTEFCFMPHGYFAIDSIGRVVRPRDTADAYTASDCELIAESRMTVVVKLYDAVRQTTQKQFYQGTLAARTHLPLTNGNRSLEIGPEPDQGNAPSETEWDGYIQLATVGGLGVNHAKNTCVPTPAGSGEMGSVMHAHFSGDFLLHHHQDGIRHELGYANVAGEKVSNLPDRTEAAGGPYSPTHGGGNFYRIARSFRAIPGASFPALAYRAPVDLRLDGAYSERHSAPAYWLSPSILGPNIAQSQGVISLWVKPSFYPEMSGKPRTWLSMDRKCTGYINPSPFVLIYTATHDTPAFSPSTAENGTPFYNTGWPFGPQAFRPMSLGWGYGYSGSTGYGAGTIAEGGVATPTLNHVGHADGKASQLKGHEWMHVVVTWRPQDPNDCKIYVNGQILAGTAGVWYTTYKPDSGVDWSKHLDGSQNTLRLGSVSRYSDEAGWGYKRNWAADATIDEVYVWNNVSSVSAALGQWQEGRYYKITSAQEGHFTSGPIDLVSGARTLVPTSTTAVSPYETLTAPTAPTVTSAGASVQILGLSWTWLGEGVDANGQEILVDRASGDVLQPKVQISIVSGPTTYGPYGDARFSSLPAAAVFTGPFQYRVHFSVPDQQFDTILHATPVFDDVTIFYRRGGTEFETWIRQ